jgi:hypothetical protein
VAARALAGRTDASQRPTATDVAWLHLVPAGAAALRDQTAAVLRADGLAVPVVFDEDGFALVAGTVPGEARILLAPRLPSYDPAPP